MLAVRTADVLLAVVAAAIEKLADDDPPANVTDDGPFSNELLLANPTETPPDGAGWFRETVQVEVLPGTITEGLQTREVRPSVPPVKLPVWGGFPDGGGVVDDDGGGVDDDGGGVDDDGGGVDDDGGGVDDDGGGVDDDGGVTGEVVEVVTEMLPPVAAMETAAAVGETPIVFAIPIPTELTAVGASVTITIAATPFEIMLLLRPESMHW
jgi:hypothetical protein